MTLNTNKFWIIAYVHLVSNKRISVSQQSGVFVTVDGPAPTQPYPQSAQLTCQFALWTSCASGQAYDVSAWVLCTAVCFQSLCGQPLGTPLRSDPLALAATDLALALVCHVVGIAQHTTFSRWFLSLSKRVYVFSMCLHGCVARFFLPQVVSHCPDAPVYPFSCWRAPWLFPQFDSYKESC